MSDSPLSFSATKNFRDALLTRNLPPYNIPGYFSSPVTEITEPITISDSSVIDSPNEIITRNPFADQLYPLNRFGPDGGFVKDITYNNPPLAVIPNQGPYDVMDAGLSVINEFFLENAYVKNIYGPEGGYNENYVIGETQNNNHIYLPYWEPPVFRPSSYSPYNILISDNPAGSDGSLSLDSYLVQFAAKELQLVLKYRAALQDNPSVELIADRFAFSQPSSVSNQLRGNIITPNNDFRITLPADTDSFLTRLQGVYYPSSPIPGDYFLDEQSTRSTGSIGQLINVFAGRSTLLGDILGPGISRVINPSIVFLSSTGAGQKSALFENLSYNRFKPQYGSTALGGIAQNLLTTGINAILNATGTQLPGDYYVGSVVSDPSQVENPVRDVPIDAFGKETGAVVYGPSEMGILYEGNESNINFGLQAVSTQDGGGIMGSFVWVSPKYQQNAGFIAGPGGEMIRQDSEFNQLNSDFEKNKSTTIDFKVGSILDETQRLINSADNVTGLRRLRHVGNAINQVSKVFNDGYKELTKGSKVVLYRNESGQEVGAEYCRVFAKDTPYYTFNDLQKKDGNIRKFSYSVLDKTFNLNIAPLKGPNSTNITNNSVKKYMFSIENLAWKNTNRAGLRWDDLPVCERGPNRGRIMWFPPYDLKVTESSTPSFNPTTFLGRPEPIYTYKDTSRQGTLAWKIIVDHPSILNVIVNKVLANERNRTKINDIVDSFFAGCKKYDIYDLAARYNTIPTKDLEAYQEMLSDPRLTREQLASINNAIPKDGRSDQNADVTTNKETNVNELQSYLNLGSYFEPGYPISDVVYSVYIELNYPQFTTNVVTPEFQKLEMFAAKLEEILLTEKYTITVNWTASNSPDETNISLLNDYRLKSVKLFLEQYNSGSLKKYIDNSKLVLSDTLTTTTEVTVNSRKYDCNLKIQENEYSCRSIRISNINITGQDEEKPVTPLPEKDINKLQTGLKPSSDTDPLSDLKQGLSKKVLRSLLSECDYFDVIEDTSPMIYDSIREKIKYFNPAFHSTTPEGLNSRLTFLQQCVRPGDTIPTINEDGTPRYDDAINTAFGTPPVLVLRIGDFYHTKIIPTSLQINYEPLVFDLNPEGIGVQPMIANISLGFNFIGGNGLAKPIEQLQNALSFNYYANTEMYDERAEATEDTSKLDRQVYQQILESQPPVTQPDNKLSNDGGNTITTILTSSGTSISLSGTTSLKTKMNEFVDDTQSYFDVITNQLTTFVESYNRGIMEIVSQTRNYKDGTVFIPSSQSAPIYGKPEGVQNSIDSLFDTVTSEIDNDQNYIVKELKNLSFTTTVLDDVKKNMKAYLLSYKEEMSTGIFGIIQSMTEKQEKYIQYIRKLNFVSSSIDGKIDNKGNGIIYTLTPTTDVHPTSNNVANTLIEFENDYKKIATDLTNYDTFVTTNFLVNYYQIPAPFSTMTDKNFYLVATQIFYDKTKMDDFISKVTNGISDTQNFKRKFENICDDLHRDYKREYKKNVDFMNDLTKGSSYKDFRKYKPFSKDKKRVFDFTSVPPGTPTQITDLQNLYKSYNIDSNTSTYLNKIKFN